jgi:hypothetical protein
LLAVERLVCHPARPLARLGVRRDISHGALTPAEVAPLVEHTAGRY